MARGTEQDGEGRFRMGDRGDRTGQDKMRGAEPRCVNNIKKVLEGDEVAFLKRLFTLSKRVAPVQEILGILDLSSSPDCASCQFQFTWGYTAYCCNETVLAKVVSR